MKQGWIILTAALLFGCASTSETTSTASQSIPELAEQFQSVNPIILIEPKYPKRAAEKRKSGWVHLRFDVSTLGAVQNIRVVDSYPKRYGFEHSAGEAVKRWKYKPLWVDGKALVRKNHEVVVTFGKFKTTK
ncbi:hypothetical protein GCM10011369_17430 [Neiella marina]|uniref:Protein TonB n=1 Tax=Neiella marina TaxID=508461 RepID=A0A8J2XNV1_9GAMM|nr:energy transducer TonB [Neiella marina]GGA76061.1 hypothetical protein GCM10011369_17430 [Neiella marina]